MGARSADAAPCSPHPKPAPIYDLRNHVGDEVQCWNLPAVGDGARTEDPRIGVASGLHSMTLVDAVIAQLANGERPTVGLSP